MIARVSMAAKDPLMIRRKRTPHPRWESISPGQETNDKPFSKSWFVQGAKTVPPGGLEPPRELLPSRF